jgi:ATPase subunit of ABC transporter with duplicated ATPase domains
MTLAGRDLTIGYSDRVVGRGLNVALAQGEVLALLGPNGGGKTTLLKTLLGILNPRAGEGGDRRTLARGHFDPRARAAHRLCAASARADLRLHGRERSADGPHRPWHTVQPAVGARPRGGGARARAVRHPPPCGAAHIP